MVSNFLYPNPIMEVANEGRKKINGWIDNTYYIFWSPPSHKAQLLATRAVGRTPQECSETYLLTNGLSAPHPMQGKERQKAQSCSENLSLSNLLTTGLLSSTICNTLTPLFQPTVDHLPIMNRSMLKFSSSGS